MDKSKKTRVGICEVSGNDKGEIETGNGAVVEVPNDLRKDLNKDNEREER